MDALQPKGCWALLKLVTGALRVGMSARLAKTASAMVRPDSVSKPPDPEGHEARRALETFREVFTGQVSRGDLPGHDEIVSRLDRLEADRCKA
jgi:hypothetical protein